MRPATPRWWQPLHVRVALVVVPLLLALCASVFAIVQRHGAQAALETTQRMNLGLAQYVVEHQPTPLINAQGEADGALLKDLALNVMMINPAVEVYLLDAHGAVLGHALEGVGGAKPSGQRVDLAPVQSLLSASAPDLRLPVLGHDPRQPGRRNIVSVAPVRAQDSTMGYLYIVLNGQALQSATASLANSDTLRTVAAGLALAGLVAALLMWLALRQLTRPLRELTSELREFRSESGEPVVAGSSGSELAVLRAAVTSLQARVAQQFKRLEDSDQQRRELVSNISHDLRTPLSSIQGYVETVLLRGDQLGAEQRTAHLRTALRHVDLLGKRIADLFELSKLDAGRVEPQREVFCLAELLQDVVQNYQWAAQQREVRLVLSAGSHLAARVSADIALIERVLQNLVDNALRYTPAGGEVTVALNASGSQLEISVSDTGRGIAQEHLPHIFERYWRASEAEPSTPGASSGLGLAIVKRILDLHGSAVRVQSELARGTRIDFLLPQAT